MTTGGMPISIKNFLKEKIVSGRRIDVLPVRVRRIAMTNATAEDAGE